MFVLSLSLPIQTWLSIKLSWLRTHSLNKSIFFFFIINAFSVATIWTPNEQVWNHLESGFGIRGNLKLLTPSFSERRNITAHSGIPNGLVASHFPPRWPGSFFINDFHHETIVISASGDGPRAHKSSFSSKSTNIQTPLLPVTVEVYSQPWCQFCLQWPLQLDGVTLVCVPHCHRNTHQNLRQTANELMLASRSRPSSSVHPQFPHQPTCAWNRVTTQRAAGTVSPCTFCPQRLLGEPVPN